jgi:hypothetical protein
LGSSEELQAVASIIAQKEIASNLFIYKTPWNSFFNNNK